MPVGDRNLLLNFARLHELEGLKKLAVTIASSQSSKGHKENLAALEGAIKQLTKQL